MTELAKMNKPYFILIGDFQAVLDIQRESDEYPKSGVLYYTDKDDEVCEYELTDEEVESWENERVLVHFGPEGDEFANFDELMEKVETSEQEHLMFEKSDILAHIASIKAFFAEA